MALRSPQPGDLNLISICTGGGGLDRAVELAIPAARPVVCVEREAFAVASLVAQIEDGLMAPAAVWSDVRTFDGRPWRGLVDGLIGGIPCQPHSLAGRRGGSTDERDLWSPTRRIIAQARPWFVLIENVGGMLSAGADEVPGAYRVRRDLRKLGYEVEGGLFRASDVGLPHERERIFILGVADSYRQLGDGPWLERAAGRRQSADGGSILADPGCSRRKGRRPPGDRPGQRSAAERGGEHLGDAERSGLLPGALASIHRQQEGSGPRHGAPERSGEPVEHALSGGRDGRPEGAERWPQQRAAEQLAGAIPDEQRLPDPDGAEPAAQRRDTGEVRSLPEGEGGAEHRAALPRGGRPSLRPPGPGDTDAWRAIAECAPRLLPAVSRYDLFRLEMGAQGFAPDGDPSAGAWVDPQTGARPHPAQLQAAAQSAIRGVADVLATRIDELRMLGNGVADAQGALAVRTLVHELATRSAGAALLVRMMEDSE